MSNKILITGGSGFIGTNLIDYIVKKYNEISIINIDINPPKISSQNKYWIECDILDKEKLEEVFHKNAPNYIIHLAARTDILGKSLEEYKVNTEGTNNILNAIKQIKSIKRVIITSTQFVHQFSGQPKSDLDYAPYTVYGESKVISEKLTREACLSCIWTIIRPTNVWGAWHPRYPEEFWRTIAQGKYLHPGKRDVIRSYGYVKNVIHQILRIFDLDEELVNKQVFYVGDEPIQLLDWVNAFSREQIKRDVIVVPEYFIYLLSIFGDILGAFKINFPITRTRFKSMTTSNPAPMKKTFQVLGPSPYNLNEAVIETMIWLKNEYPQLVKHD